MRICVAFLLVLLFLSCVPVQAEINPSVDTKPFFCRYTLTDWTPLCPIVGTGGAGSGSTFVNSENNTFYYNTTSNESIIYGNTTNFFNTTIGNNLTTFSNYTYWNIVNITYSEMNQTPGPQGPQGIQGEIGPEGPMNQTPNMTAGPPGPMNMTPNMTAGPPGPQGPQGIQGEIGPEGPMNQTPNMTAGPPGPMNMTPNMTAGPAGATGATGPAGLDANVSTTYPIGSVYTTNSTSSAATLLGFGTWSLIGDAAGTIQYETKRAPAGCSRSTDQAGYECAKAYDGNTASMWVASSVAQPQWINLDLGSSYYINDLRLYFQAASATTTHNVSISTDNTTFTEIISSSTKTDNVWTNRTFTGTSARYVKIWTTACSGGQWAALAEFEVRYVLSKSLYYWERTA